MFLKSVAFPIFLAALCITLIIVMVNALFRFVQLDIWILRFVGVLAAWYFLGPILLDWLNNVLNIEIGEGIKVLYTPIQSIISAFGKIV